MAYSKQTWDTTSYVNPTRMNHIEDGIADLNFLIGGANTETSFGMFTTEFPNYTIAGVKIRNTQTGRYVIIGSAVAGTSVTIDDRKSLWLYNSWGGYAVKVLGTSI